MFVEIFLKLEQDQPSLTRPTVSYQVESLVRKFYASVWSKETKFGRGAAQVGPGIGLDFHFPLERCTHTYIAA